MEIKIKSQEQLESIVYTYMMQYENCVIELLINNKFKEYFITYRTPSTYQIILIYYYTDNSYSKVVNDKDGKIIMEFIKHCCDSYDWNEIYEIVIKLVSEEGNTKIREKLNYKNEYVKSYNETVKRDPIMITNIIDAEELFIRFLNEEDCDRIIYAMGITIQDLKYTYCLETIVEKVVLGVGQFVSIMTRRKDSKGLFTDFIVMEDDDIKEYMPRNYIYKFAHNNECTHHLLDNLRNTLIDNFRRCMMISNEEVEIYVRSNCELI